MLTTGSSFSLHPATHDVAAASAPAQPVSSSHAFSFTDFLDIVNPLQHLPVVGTLYRAITGDKIDTPEKIVGDTLFGGVWGLVSSLADTAFEAVTGKDFGATVLSFVTGGDDDAPAQAAEAKPQQKAAPAQPDVTALTASLNAQGLDYETTQRALAAYRRTSVPAFAD
jgi:hypothetical protein